jgi:hypothetical protein
MIRRWIGWVFILLVTCVIIFLLATPAWAQVLPGELAWPGQADVSSAVSVDRNSTFAVARYPGIHLVGRVNAINLEAGTFTLERPMAVDLVIKVIPETKFNGEVNELAKIQVGQTAAVIARLEPDKTYTALSVYVIANTRHIAGRILAVDTSSGTFQLLDLPSEVEITLKTDATTRYVGGNEAVASLADLQPGMLVGVQARVAADDEIFAQTVFVSRIRPLPEADEEYLGRITALSETSLGLAGRDGKSYTFAISPNTLISAPNGRELTLSDLRIGMPAAVGAVMLNGGSLEAVWIISGGGYFSPLGQPIVQPRIIEPRLPPRFVSPNDAPVPRPQLPRPPRRWRP